MKVRYYIGAILFIFFLFAMMVIVESNFPFLTTIALIVADFLVGLVAAKLTKEK